MRGAARFLPALAWAALIFALSSLSDLPPAMEVFVARDKLAHAAAYGVLALLLIYGARWPKGRALWLWAGLAVVYGASDELHQLFVPLRHADVFDLAADAVGAMGVAALVRLGALDRIAVATQRAQRKR